MKLKILNNILSANEDFMNLLERIRTEKECDGKTMTLNFRDPKYSYEAGGYHPVEIRINPKDEIEYITDFAYNGIPPFVELEKCLDFDFSCNVLQSNGMEFPLKAGAEIFDVWQENFCQYVEMGIFQIEATKD